MYSRYENYHENKAHTTPDFPYNTYLCSIPLDFPEVDLHWHSEVEIIVIKKGSGIVEVDLTSYEAEEGSMLFILPGQLHAIRQKDGCSMEYENILFETSFVGADRTDSCGRLLSDLFEGRILCHTMINENCSYYTQAMEFINRIDALCSTQIHGYRLGVKGNLIMLLHIIISNCRGIADREGKRSVERVKLILSYISENYSHDITMGDAAEVCCYSKSHFMRFFRSAMGESFTSYLSSYRLKIASQLLLSTGDTVLEIAGKTGFGNLSYFNRLFKEKFGVTPTQYRKRLVLD